MWTHLLQDDLILTTSAITLFTNKATFRGLGDEVYNMNFDRDRIQSITLSFKNPIEKYVYTCVCIYICIIYNSANILYTCIVYKYSLFVYTSTFEFILLFCLFCLFHTCFFAFLSLFLIDQIVLFLFFL